MKRNQRAEFAKHIYETYINRNDAPKMVNIDSHTSENITDSIKENHFSKHLFDDASDHCYRLILSGSFPQFIRSIEFFRYIPIFSKFLAPVVPGEVTNKLVDYCIHTNGWDQIPERKGIDMYYRERDEYIECKGIGILDHDPEELASIILDFSPSRKKWDSTFISAEVEIIGDDIIHVVYENKFNHMHVQYNVVVAKKELMNGDVAVVMLSCNCDLDSRNVLVDVMEGVNEKKCNNFGDINLSGWLFSKNEEMDHTLVYHLISEKPINENGHYIVNLPSPRINQLRKYVVSHGPAADYSTLPAASRLLTASLGFPSGKKRRSRSPKRRF
eukprot:TRINITY_DN5803_c0_g1_i1.p1 TRINITY_DN5803_c0_g1~~TRINITY_DN5803_c0_g1_i1.p1  ORF type:complete len:379 (-),score=61.99 TRINITY_DN5803_c0_g1_i1:32-1018(-)